MSVASPAFPVSKTREELPLEPGDHLDQPTFHARYEAMPKHIRAELIGGVVYMPSPVRSPHGKFHARIVHWLVSYSDATPGTVPLDNTTSILGDDSEPQPDAMLRIINGQSKETDDEYILGAPEFVVEIASSSASYDLYAKKDDYERYGVREYVILLVHEERAVRFIRQEEKFVEVPVDPDGILRSSFMPGLWLDVAAFFKLDSQKIETALKLGLASAAHAEFVRSLKKK